MSKKLPIRMIIKQKKLLIILTWRMITPKKVCNIQINYKKICLKKLLVELKKTTLLCPIMKMDIIIILDMKKAN